VLILFVVWWPATGSGAAGSAPTGPEEEAVLWGREVLARASQPPAAWITPVVDEPEEAPGNYRHPPGLPRNGETPVILERLQRTIELLQEAIRMQQEPRTPDNVARSDGVLYTAYKYLGAANTGVEMRIDRQIRGKKVAIKDPVLDTALRTLEKARLAHVRGAMNANQSANTEATVRRAEAAIALIQQAMALVF
jgi:hypothetical protein